MSAASLISVVVPHHGPPEMTRQLCEQLLRQDDVSLEIVVVDDFSPCPAVEMDGVRVIRTLSNEGFGTAVNTGVHASRGRLLLILNSDISLEPDAVRRLVDAAAPWQPCVAAPALLHADGAVQDSRHRWPSAARSAAAVARPLPHLMHIGKVRAWILETRPVAARGPSAAEWVSGAALLVPRDVYLQAGGFDESFFMFAEDVDLQRRLTAMGVPSRLFAEARMVHLGGGSTDRDAVGEWSRHALWTYARKHGYDARLRRMFYGVALVNLAWNALGSCAGRRTEPLAHFRSDWARPRDVVRTAR